VWEDIKAEVDGFDFRQERRRTSVRARLLLVSSHEEEYDGERMNTDGGRLHIR
jgi:hypothetical protein